MISLRKYLEDTCNKAISVVFPELKATDYVLTFYKPRYNSCDVSTSICNQLAARLKCDSPESIAKRVLSNFNWNEFYIHRPDTEFNSNSFLNFKISIEYLIELLFQSPVFDIPCQKLELQNKEMTNVFEKLLRIVDHAKQQGLYDKFPDLSEFSKHIIKNEREILLLIAMFDFTDLFSGRMFFIRKLLIMTEKYYKIVPIISNDRYFTSVRLLLIRRVIEKIQEQCI